MLLLGAVDVMSGRFKAFDSRRARSTPMRSSRRRRSRRCSGPCTPAAGPTGTACSPRIRPSASFSTPLRTSSGSSRSIRRSVGRAEDRVRDRRPSQRTRGQPVAVPRAALHREGRPAAGRGHSRWRPVPTHHRPGSRDEPLSADRVFGAASKLNRDPLFIRKLVGQGLVKADEFLAALEFERAWTAGDVESALGCFADDARLASEAPFPRRDAVSGKPAIRRFLGPAPRPRGGHRRAAQAGRRRPRHVVGALAPARVGGADGAARSRRRSRGERINVLDPGGCRRGVARRLATRARVRTRRASSTTGTAASAGSPPASPPTPPGARAR